ncbi:MAG: peptidase [Nitrosopumilaceae archaeon]
MSGTTYANLRVNLIKIYLIFIATILVIPIYTSFEAEASHNPHLYVSAENPLYNNHFAGSMVIEVVVSDNDFSDIGEAEGEPDVTLNGNDLRMVQATDGKWYAYFANVNLAKKADQIVANAGALAEGNSLDFGVFCSKNTAPSVLGTSFSNTEGVAVPRSGALAGYTNGEASFTACINSPTGSVLNNVVRNPRSVNTNPSVPPGQIGIDPNAWPIIQLFSFDSVTIKFNRAGGTERVNLEYDEIPNISAKLDRKGYPTNAEVFLTINDFQLNQDPTDEDSWTFNVVSNPSTFYQAFTESGSDSGNNSPGLINLVPHLSKLEFDDNGKLTIDIGNVAKLKTNKHQPVNSVSDTVNTFSQIVTLVESERNTGIFESFDSSNISTIGIQPNAPRGQSATITYNDQTTSILSGSTTASISMSSASGKLIPGQLNTITLTDNDQNTNSGSRDILNVFRDTAIIPTLKLGQPITLDKASNLKFYTLSTDPLSGGFSVGSSVPDKNSKRLIVDTIPIGVSSFDAMSLNMGINAEVLKNLLINVNTPDDAGTNWINYDLRSFEKQLGITSFSDTSMTLHFGGLPGATQIQILDPGDISSGKGLLQIDDTDVSAINLVSNSATVFLVINFDSSNDPGSEGTISNEIESQPIVIDLFSFGTKNNQNINNAIYRFELKETSNNSGIFVGTMEYAVTNQINQFDPNFIKTLRTIDEKIKFLVTDRLIDEKGISISYSDLADVGLTISTSTKSDIRTNSGTASFTSNTYRFGQPVYFVLNDPDLNLKHDKIEIYNVVNDPASPNVDTVGTSSGEILVEILIKDIRYKRCTINGVEYGGLGSTGFSLVETGPDTGIFEGSFKLPTQICDKTGTKLISTAGGNLDAKYHDFSDSSGNKNIFSSTSLSSSFSGKKPPTLSTEKIILPKYKQTSDVILSGTVDNYIQGTTLDINLIGPDKSSEKFSVYATKNGEYKVVLTIKDTSLTGKYNIDINYRGSKIGDASFHISKHLVAEWIKNNAGWWASDQISDSEFIKGIEHLIKEKIIIIPNSSKSSNTENNIPSWIKNTAKWWSQGDVSDDEFVAALEFLVKNSIIRI